LSKLPEIYATAPAEVLADSEGSATVRTVVKGHGDCALLYPS